MTKHSLRATLLAALAALVPAQTAAAPPTEAAALLPAVIPVHSAPDDEVGGAYGIWAAGRDYKVSFHDGVAFRPYGPRGGVFRWRTKSIAAAGREVAARDQAPELRWTDHRVEIDHGTVVEAYDVRADGVEQTFVLRSRPPAGELRITGAIDGGLQCVETAARPGELVFAGRDGAPAVRYGAAAVIDAAGRRAAVATAYAGGLLTLHVDPTWLAEAAYPVVVDPLVSNGDVASGGPRIVSADVHRDDQENDLNLWITYSFEAGPGDVDLVTVRADENAVLGVVTVFADLAATRSAVDGRLAGIGGTGRVVTVFSRTFLQTSPVIDFDSAVRWHAHDKTDATLRTAFGSVPKGADDLLGAARVGGSFAFAVGRFALIVYERDRSTTGIEVLGRLIDLAASEQGTLGAELQIATAANGGGTNPTVNAEADGGPLVRWLVAWQTRRGSGRLGIAFAEVDSTGTIRRSGLSTEDDADAGTNKLGPVLAGSGGRYLLAYRQVDAAAPGRDRVRVQRIDWDHAQGLGHRPHAAVTLESSLDEEHAIGGCAFDTNTRCHWAVQYSRSGPARAASVCLDRVGFRGRAIDREVVHAALSAGAALRHAGSVAFDDDAEAFPLVFAARELGREIVGVRRLTTAAVAPESVYGTTCTPALLDWEGAQRIGGEFEGLRVRGASVAGLAAFVVGLQPANLDLASLGLPGCRLLVDPQPGSLIGSFAVVPNAGVARLAVPLLEQFPGVQLRVQAFHHDGTAFVATRGIAVAIVR